MTVVHLNTRVPSYAVDLLFAAKVLLSAPPNIVHQCLGPLEEAVAQFEEQMPLEDGVIREIGRKI